MLNSSPSFLVNNTVNNAERYFLSTLKIVLDKDFNALSIPILQVVFALKKGVDILHASV
jgi:hypothetical protein